MFTKLLLTYMIRLNNITILLITGHGIFRAFLSQFSLAAKGNVDGIASLLNITRKPSLAEILYTREIASDE